MKPYQYFYPSLQHLEFHLCTVEHPQHKHPAMKTKTTENVLQVVEISLISYSKGKKYIS